MTAQREVAEAPSANRGRDAVTAQREVADDILRNVRVMLRWALLEDVEVVTRFGGNPKLLQVRRGGEVVFSATVRGREAAPPTPRQEVLKGTEDVVARSRFSPEEGSAPSTPGESHAPELTVASLGLHEVRIAGSLDDARKRFPEMQWRRVGGGSCGALTTEAVAVVLREAGAQVALFDPSLDPPVIVEVWDLSDEGKELASQLARELDGVVLGPKQQHSGTHVERWVELPATGDPRKLAWVLSYLVENKVRFWVKPSMPRKPRGGRGGVR